MRRKKRKNKDESNLIKQILLVLFFLSALITGFLNIDINSIKTNNIDNPKSRI